MTDDPLSDSAGVPWSGRHFEENPWSSDDGTASPEVAAALELLAQSERAMPQLLSALRGSRLLVPLLASLGEQAMGPHGHLVEKSADLSVVAVATPDGASALPVFSSVAAMTRWSSKSRPVPASSERIAVAAVEQGHTRIVLDPAGPAIGLRLPFLAALATGSQWISPEVNPAVRLAVNQSITGLDAVVGYELIAGDPFGKLLNPELLIELRIRPGLSSESLNELLTVAAHELATQEFQELVDSFGFRVVSAQGQ